MWFFLVLLLQLHRQAWLFYALFLLNYITNLCMDISLHTFPSIIPFYSKSHANNNSLWLPSSYLTLWLIWINSSSSWHYILWLFVFLVVYFPSHSNLHLHFISLVHFIFNGHLLYGYLFPIVGCFPRIYTYIWFILLFSLMAFIFTFVIYWNILCNL